VHQRERVLFDHSFAIFPKLKKNERSMSSTLPYLFIAEKIGKNQVLVVDLGFCRGQSFSVFFNFLAEKICSTFTKIWNQVE
jgi:hypothetical protein